MWLAFGLARSLGQKLCLMSPCPAPVSPAPPSMPRNPARSPLLPAHAPLPLGDVAGAAHAEHVLHTALRPRQVLGCGSRHVGHALRIHALRGHVIQVAAGGWGAVQRAVSRGKRAGQLVGGRRRHRCCHPWRACEAAPWPMPACTPRKGKSVCLPCQPCTLQVATTRSRRLTPSFPRRCAQRPRPRQ